MSHIHVKATRDIKAGEEIFLSYGDSDWFEYNEITYISVDAALTRWRPELTPLPCRQPVIQKNAGSDGDVSFIITRDVSEGTVLETSVCLKVPADAVDTYSIGDVVLTGHTENMHAAFQ